jgi:ribosomal protein L29
MPHVDDHCTTHFACDCITEQVQTLKAENAELRTELAERDATYRRIIEERCPTDEQHCTCVPALRQEVARLRTALRYYADRNNWRTRIDWMLAQQALAGPEATE